MTAERNFYFYIFSWDQATSIVTVEADKNPSDSHCECHCLRTWSLAQAISIFNNENSKKKPTFLDEFAIDVFDWIQSA